MVRQINFVKYLATSTAITLITISGAAAGGLTQYERSAGAQGASFAGATAGSGGIQSMGFNPAALGLVDNNALSIGISAIDTSYEGQPNVGGVPIGAVVDPGETSVLGYGYIGHRINESLLIGLGINQPFGVSTEYPLGWLGQFDALTTSIDTVQFTPTIAYQPEPGITFAVSANILHTEIDYTSAAIAYDLDATEFSFSVGTLLDVTDNTTIGIAYHHGFDLDADGGARPTGAPLSFSTNANFELPAIASLGVVHDVNDDFRLMGEAQWQNWSDFDRISIVAPVAALVQTDVYDFDDSYFFAIGGEVDMMQDALTLRAGVAWDGTPTNTGTVTGQFPPIVNPFGTNRSVRLPQEDRVWLSVGGSYRANDNMTLDFGYSYIYSVDDALVNFRNAPAGSNASFDENTHSFSFAVTIAN